MTIGLIYVAETFGVKATAEMIIHPSQALRSLREQDIYGPGFEVNKLQLRDLRVRPCVARTLRVHTDSQLEYSISCPCPRLQLHVDLSVKHPDLMRDDVTYMPIVHLYVVIYHSYVL